MTKPKPKVDIKCAICGVIFRYKNNKPRHEKTKYHKIVEFYKKKLEELNQNYQLKESEVKV